MNGERWPHSTPIADYFWQVVASVSSAAIAGLFFWLWNVSLDIRDLQNARTDLARVIGEISSARQIIDRNSDRLTKLEAGIEQNREIIKGIYGALDGIRAEVTGARDVALKRTAEDARLAEVVRQLELHIQIHTQDERQDPSASAKQDRR